MVIVVILKRYAIVYWDRCMTYYMVKTNVITYSVYTVYIRTYTYIYVCIRIVYTVYIRRQR